MLNTANLLNVDNSASEVQREGMMALAAFLARLPHVQLRRDGAPVLEGAFGFALETESRAHRLRLVVRSRAWPQEMVALIHLIRTRLPEPETVIFAAPQISAQSQDILREAGISWIDFAGNGEVAFADVYLSVQGRVLPETESRRSASLYSPRASQAIHALLLSPYQRWRVRELSEVAGISLGLASNVRGLLQERQWVGVADDGFWLTEPAALLDDWGNHYHPVRQVLRYFSLDGPDRLIERLNETVAGYALTEFAAADHYAPYARTDQMAFYVPVWLDSFAVGLGLRAGAGASNVTVYVSPDALRFTNSGGGQTYASPVQTYLDLRRLPGRAQDAAEHLRQVALEPMWR